MKSIISTGLRPTEGREGNREWNGTGLKAVKIRPKKKKTKAVYFMAVAVSGSKYLYLPCKVSNVT